MAVSGVLISKNNHCVNNRNSNGRLRVLGRVTVRDSCEEPRFGLVSLLLAGEGHCRESYTRLETFDYQKVLESLRENYRGGLSA